MLVLVACEESQEVCKAFRAKGHTAFSCDIQDCSGGKPEWHLKGDVLDYLDCEKWDLIIAHPPCTYLTVTGNRWFDVEKYGQKAIDRQIKRIQAVVFFLKLANADCERICIENPVGVMSRIYRKPDQIIQPYFFGEPYEKKTCLWLKNLPPLKSMNVLERPERVRFASGRTMPKWYADAWKLKPEERARQRSRTFHGIAQAMAEQWG